MSTKGILSLFACSREFAVKFSNNFFAEFCILLFGFARTIILIVRCLFSTVLALAIVFLSAASSVSALSNQLVTTPAPKVAEVNSFELFWPVVAGRTRGDNLYFLKNLKEKIRGLLIFGAPQKLDYLSFLTVKRTVEAEALLKAGKIDLAESTLVEGQKLLDDAKKVFVSGKEAGVDFSQVGSEVVRRLENIEKLIAWLEFKDSANEERFSGFREKLSSLKAVL